MLPLRRRRERSRSPPDVARRTEFITSFSSEPSAAAASRHEAASYVELPRGGGGAAAPSHTQAPGPALPPQKRSVPQSPVPVMMTSSCRQPSRCCLTVVVYQPCPPTLRLQAAPAA